VDGYGGLHGLGLSNEAVQLLVGVREPMSFLARCPFCSAGSTLADGALGADVSCAQCRKHFTAAPSRPKAARCPFCSASNAVPDGALGASVLCAQCHKHFNAAPSRAKPSAAGNGAAETSAAVTAPAVP
jgi:hypothetical protein